jgi:hypothetical protein
LNGRFGTPWSPRQLVGKDIVVGCIKCQLRLQHEFASDTWLESDRILGVRDTLSDLFLRLLGAACMVGLLATRSLRVTAPRPLQGGAAAGRTGETG